MSGITQRLVPLAVQVAIVCTVLVIGLIPLTAPLPAMTGAATAAAATAGILLALSVSALGTLVLIPRWFRLRSPLRMVGASVIGTAAAVLGFIVTAGLITRPLLLVTAAALLLVAAGTTFSRLVAVGHDRRGRTGHVAE